MSRALDLANTHMFTKIGLNRIMANYRPENVKSAALLKRLGFRIEGYAKNYLRLDGDWRDHVLTAKTSVV
jgi:ribosomal-protein-alanine N-acetyltransferase